MDGWGPGGQVDPVFYPADEIDYHDIYAIVNGHSKAIKHSSGIVYSKALIKAYRDIIIFLFTVERRYKVLSEAVNRSTLYPKYVICNAIPYCSA